MGRTFDQQEEYIQDLLDEVNRGKADKHFLQGIWRAAEAKKGYISDPTGQKYLYQVRLKEYGCVWGSDEDEHTSWIRARQNLKDRDIFTGFVQKMDEKEQKWYLVNSLNFVVVGTQQHSIIFMSTKE